MKQLTKEEMINQERVLNDLGIWQKEVIAMVMQNYANQQAISFAEFINQNNWKCDKNYGWYDPSERVPTYFTTEQLYELFNQQK